MTPEQWYREKNMLMVSSFVKINADLYYVRKFRIIHVILDNMSETGVSKLEAGIVGLTAENA